MFKYSFLEPTIVDYLLLNKVITVLHLQDFYLLKVEPNCYMFSKNTDGIDSWTLYIRPSDGYIILRKDSERNPLFTGITKDNVELTDKLKKFGAFIV